MTRRFAAVTLLALALCGCSSGGDPAVQAASPSPLQPQAAADATASIQAMINAGSVNLPCGSYYVTTLQWPGLGPSAGAVFSGCDIAGGTRITATGDGPAIKIDHRMERSVLRQIHLVGGLRIDAPVSLLYIEHNQFDGRGSIEVGPSGSVIGSSIRENVFLEPVGETIFADPSSNLNAVEFSHNWFQSPAFTHYVHLPFHTADRCQDIHFRSNVYEGPSNNIPVVIGGCGFVSFEFEHWADFFGAQPMIAEEGGVNGAPVSLLIINPVGLKLSPGIPGATLVSGAPPFEDPPCAIATYRLGQWSCLDR